MLLQMRTIAIPCRLDVIERCDKLNFALVDPLLGDASSDEGKSTVHGFCVTAHCVRCFS